MPDMGMWNSAQILFRFPLLLFGLGSAALSAVWLPEFGFAAPAKDVTARLLADDRFQEGTLNSMLKRMQASPGPVVLRSDVVRGEALIRLRLEEEAIERNSPQEIDRFMAAKEVCLSASLSLNPTDSFLWLRLYSLEVMRHGLDARAVGLLDQSFATGPLEGWIAIRRNGSALAVFPTLSASLQAKVVSEFTGMVDSGFVENAASNLIGSGWTQKDRLLASLANTNMISREFFAKQLVREGLKLEVPGVKVDDRIWR